MLKVTKFGLRESKTPEGRATLKYVSFSELGEKKFYVENIPGGRFYILGESFLYIKSSPFGMNFSIEKLPWGKILYIENHPEGRFSI